MTHIKAGFLRLSKDSLINGSELLSSGFVEAGQCSTVLL
jgi:hypothetical protein